MKPEPRLKQRKLKLQRRWEWDELVNHSQHKEQLRMKDRARCPAQTTEQKQLSLQWRYDWLIAESAKQQHIIGTKTSLYRNTFTRIDRHSTDKVSGRAFMCLLVYVYTVATRMPHLYYRAGALQHAVQLTHSSLPASLTIMVVKLYLWTQLVGVTTPHHPRAYIYCTYSNKIIGRMYEKNFQCSLSAINRSVWKC